MMHEAQAVLSMVLIAHHQPLALSSAGSGSCQTCQPGMEVAFARIDS